MHRIRTASTVTAIHARLAVSALGDRVADAAQRRLNLVREDAEQGAQAAEYAMLGGVSAAACGGLILALKETDGLERVVTSVLDVLIRTVGSWF